ncbi:hypothetical protein EVAR_19360_1 [Eumeta japonica]|uniref:Uncharacterized protein n=1 Tax=Eumeta variegata TaxID=151549 RepID=A0A4C1TRE4_EUMVA|nr:hypothetical protein EVAR_19360_1 [Eumeta japonica]
MWFKDVEEVFVGYEKAVDATSKCENPPRPVQVASLWRNPHGFSELLRRERRVQYNARNSAAVNYTLYNVGETGGHVYLATNVWGQIVLSGGGEEPGALQAKDKSQVLTCRYTRAINYCRDGGDIVPAP